MTTTTNVSQVKLNIMTQAQYTSATKNANELYMVTDDDTYQTKSNLVTSVSSASTNAQYPSAKLFYDTCGDIEATINAIRGV